MKNNNNLFTLSKYFRSYKFDENFINEYKGKKVNFGFNGLGEIVYRRTYSRLKSDNTNEEWYETVQRVVEGTFSLLSKHCEKNPHSNLNIDMFDQEAKIMYEKIFNFKFLPPGRGLWSMGTNITEKKNLYAALNNCAFVSTEIKNIETDLVKPYIFLMDCAMLGVGIGFDTKGSHSNFIIKGPKTDQIHNFLIPDDREGWVESVKILLDSYFYNKNQLKFDYSVIRPAGKELKTFGGVSSGPKPLIELHQEIQKILNQKINQKLDSTTIVDIMNIIGRCVIAGNIRRTAEIALGEHNDDQFINLKNYTKNPDRISWGWVSNNSIYAELGMDYSKVVKSIAENGEPGLLWLDNMRDYSRMKDKPDYRDRLAQGGNPCLEQTLESYEMCCLSETFPHHHNSISEYLETIKYAFLYAKIVTLQNTHWEETNNVINRNHRIGLSMTGIAQFLSKYNMNILKNWCEEGYTFLKNYDKELSSKLNVLESIKITSIKPSGTVSLLGGATPGVHFPHSRFYIRRVRLAKGSELVSELKNLGYHIEDDVTQPDSTAVVTFPIDVGKGVRTLNDTNIWEQLSLAAFMQKYWADNQVSCTVSFNQKTESDQISQALDFFQYQLKGISFLPVLENKTPYPQMPYEEIEEKEYEELLSKIKFDKMNKRFQNVLIDKHESNFCDSDSCVV